MSSSSDIENIKMQKKIRIGFVFGNLILASILLALSFGWRSPETFPILCPFRMLTGLYCPGCGGTRALSALIGGQFQKALIYNPLIYEIAAILLFYEISALISLIPRRTPFLSTPLFSRIHRKIARLFLLSVLLFFPLRNLPPLRNLQKSVSLLICLVG